MGLEDLLNVILACGVGSLALSSLPFFLSDWPLLSGLPRSVLVIDFAFYCTLGQWGFASLSGR